jgi:hypothetical protein
VREFALQNEGANREIVVRVHIVAAARAREDLVAEHPDLAEAGAAALIVVEIKARLAGDEPIRMTSDIGRPAAIGFDEIVAALGGAQDKGVLHELSPCLKSGPHGGGGSALRVTKDDHLKEMFGRAAVGAHPVFGDVLPTGARRNAMLRQP